MNLYKLIQEKKQRDLLRLIVKQTINELDFTQSIRKNIVHKHICDLLGKAVSNELINKIKQELLLKEIVPTRSGNKTYYRNVNYTKNYSWLKYKYLK